MAGYEKHMHAKFVMEETFMKIYHAKHYAAFQAWLENVGLLRNVSTQKTDRNIQKEMVQLFRSIYTGKQKKNDETTIELLLTFLKDKQSVGGLYHTFKRLDNKILSEIICGSTFLQLASGQVVRNYVQSQQPANFFYIIVKGKIKLYQQEEHQIAMETLEKLKTNPQYIHQADLGELKFTLNESESFGEQNLILNHPQYYTAIASTASLLFAIPRTLFYKHLIQFYKDLQDTYEKTEFLKQVPMFNNLGRSRILRMSKLLKPFSRASKYILIKSGTICDKVIFIQSGEAKVVLNPNADTSISILSQEKQNEMLEVQQVIARKKMIGEHRVKRFQHVPNKKNKKKIEILVLSANQFWGEASLLDKSLLRYENDHRMASDIIDTSSSIYMSDKKHMEMANIITNGHVKGYVLLKEQLPYFIDILQGTRCLKDISSLYEERKGLIRKRIEEENDILKQGNKNKKLSSSPALFVGNNNIKHGELYVLPAVQNISMIDNVNNTLQRVSPIKQIKQNRNVVSYRNHEDAAIASAAMNEKKRRRRNQQELELNNDNNNGVYISPIKQQPGSYKPRSNLKRKTTPKIVKGNKHLLNISPIKKITTQLNDERKRNNNKSYDDIADTNLLVAGGAAIKINDELKTYIDNVMYKDSIQGTAKAIVYPTTGKSPMHQLPLKPLQLSNM